MAADVKLPIPSKCDVCGNPNVKYCTEQEAYGSNNRRDWPYIWFCPRCKANVSCHINTNLPMGFMAGLHIRRLSVRLQEIIDPIWQTGIAKRKELYAWMAKELDIPVEISHISQLTLPQLKTAIEITKRYASLHQRDIKRRNDLRKRNQAGYIKSRKSRS